MSKPFYVRFTVPKELADAAYEVLSVVRSSGKLRRGTNEVTKAVDRGVAKLVVIAEDVEPPEIVAHLPLLCEERKVTYVYVPSKKQLGVSTGIEVQTSAACVVETGDAVDLVNEITGRINVLRKQKA